MAENTELVLTIVELAEYLKIPKSTLYKLAQEGKIPGQKVGRHWRFRRETIDRWLEQGPMEHETKSSESPGGDGE